MYSIHMAEDIVKLLSPPGSPITLVFWSPAPISNSKGNPFSGAQNTLGWEKFAIFDRYRLLSRKRQEIGRLLLLNAYRKSYALYRMMTFSMTFTDSYPRLQARIDSQPPLLTAVAPAASREFFLWQFYQKDTSMCPKNLTSILVTISISASWFFWPV